MLFFKENSYEVVRLLLFQFAMAVFGIVLIFATRMATDGAFTWLTLLASILAVLLYMYVLYATMQDLGAKDKIRVESGRVPADKRRGLKIMLFAQVPNFVVLFLMLLGYLLAYVFGAEVVGTNIFGITNILMYFMQSMYDGIIGMLTDSEPTNINCLKTTLMYIVSVVPGILVCWGSYNLGLKDKKLFALAKKDD